MKIEKVNENQIRCILNKEDLVEHKLKLSELAFGSDRARELFRDMMTQAFEEVGFDANNTPLMIEAIPMDADCIILVVTKVEDPSDLENRFANVPKIDLRKNPEEDDLDDLLDIFEQNDLSDLDPEDNNILDIDMSGYSEEDAPEFTDEEKKKMLENAMDLIAPFTRALAKAKEAALKKTKDGQAAEAEKEGNDHSDGIIEETKSVQKHPEEHKEASASKASHKLKLKPVQNYVFDSLDSVIEYSKIAAPFYEGESILYKETESNLYYLILLRYNSDEDAFLRACHLASDYATTLPTLDTTIAYMKEHFKVILEEQAIETLVSL